MYLDKIIEWIIGIVLIFAVTGHLGAATVDLDRTSQSHPCITHVNMGRSGFHKVAQVIRKSLARKFCRTTSVTPTARSQRIQMSIRL